MPNKKSYRLLTVLTDKAERGPRLFRVYVKRNRAKLRALQMAIHAEIAPKLAASRALEFVGVEKPVEGEVELPSVRKGWTWGKVQTTNGKGYLPHFHSIGKIPGDLVIENSLGHRLMAQSAQS